MPHAKNEIRERARKGSVFIHFTVRAAEAAIRAKKRLGAVARVLIEHPEDLGSTRNGVPASIWQLV